MLESRTYRVDRALLNDGTTRFVIADSDGQLHRAASAWLMYLHNNNYSPNTIENYGSRVSWYLSWTVQTADWRNVSLSHMAMWRRVVTTSPMRRSDGQTSLRDPKTVRLWMTPVRSFYEFADAHGLVTSDVARRMTEVKYFAPGSPGGGEHGASRRVLVSELRPADMSPHGEPEWLDSADARARLEALEMNARDRFIVDLLYYTGIRVGEALSLFTADMHFGGGTPLLGCRVQDPHFHVRMQNPVENGARAKGRERMLTVGNHLVERYIDYVLERQRILGDQDISPHALVNLYDHGHRNGHAMSDSGMRKLHRRVGDRIGYRITGPHMLRHTLATRMIRGIDCEAQPIDAVQEVLGHRSINSTRIYTHDLERAKKEALEAVAPRTVTLGLEE